MEQPLLSLDPKLVQQARADAQAVAAQVTSVARARTTVAIERTVLRLFGVDGVTSEGVPLPNVVVEAALRSRGLAHGIASRFCNAAHATGFEPDTLARAIASGEVSLDAHPNTPCDAARGIGEAWSEAAVALIRRRRAEREAALARSAPVAEPWLYVIVASGNIFEDVVQARIAARQGADVVAVIRSTGQSLLDYVPYGPTTEGYGGTYATRENFRIMRAALDEVGEELGRYIRLCNYASGLCMPEIAMMGAVVRLDVMLNDALYGILFRDINPVRTLTDQRMSRMLNALAGIVINTGEDNYLTTADAFEAGHTVIASTLINEALGRLAGLPTGQLGLGHAMEIDPAMADGLLWEIAQAALVRTLFPGAPIKFMPPTKYMTGNVFRGHVQDAMFNLVGVLTRQGIQLLGMMTEAMHTPHVHDRYLSLENAKYIFHNARSLGDELVIKPGGRIEGRARDVLREAAGLLRDVRRLGLLDTLATGLFADVKRPADGGRGLDGVIERAPEYWNPAEEALCRALGLPAQEVTP